MNIYGISKAIDKYFQLYFFKKIVIPTESYFTNSERALTPLLNYIYYLFIKEVEFILKSNFHFQIYHGVRLHGYHKFINEDLLSIVIQECAIVEHCNKYVCLTIIICSHDRKHNTKIKKYICLYYLILRAISFQRFRTT